MTEPAFKAMTAEEYLRLEDQSVERHEYVAGFVYPLAQAGTSDAHATITVNLVAALRPAVRRRGCFIYASDMRLNVGGGSAYYYPDLLVTCEPRQDEAKFKAAPALLIEVLSRSTAHTDPNSEYYCAKYHAYTGLESLQLYLLIEQAERRVYAYRRTAEGWQKEEYSGQDIIPLPFLEAELPLDDIYEDVRPA